LIVLLNQKD